MQTCKMNRLSSLFFIKSLDGTLPDRVNLAKQIYREERQNMSDIYVRAGCFVTIILMVCAAPCGFL